VSTKPLYVLRAGNTVPEIAARRGDFGDWIRAGVGDAWRGEWKEHDVRTDAALPTPVDAAGFIITGSSSSVTERAPWMLRTEELVRRIDEANVPLFGICFGHQLVAQALGGLVAKNPKGREIGTIDVVREGEDPLFEGMPRTLRVSATHVDAVVKLPEGARVLGTTPLDPVAAFAVGRATRCVQFHPEIDGDVMRSYLRARAHLVAAEGGDPLELLARVSDDLHGAAILRSFVTRFVVHA
jgi:GMP synthase (glutamine-hydrolysing)